VCLEYCEFLLATTLVRYQSAALALSMAYGAAFATAHILDTKQGNDTVSGAHRVERIAGRRMVSHAPRRCRSQSPSKTPIFKRA
jgi:hypothetical protein